VPRAKNKPRLEAIRAQERVSMNECLAFRATQLHSASTNGLDPKAHTLKARVHSSTCQKHPEGGYMLWVKIVLSDGSRYRLCWLYQSEHFMAHDVGLWRRVEWSKGYRDRKPPRSR
jgi:hypothetical protein